jgi:hypothetical protein
MAVMVMLRMLDGRVRWRQSGHWPALRAQRIRLRWPRQLLIALRRSPGEARHQRGAELHVVWLESLADVLVRVVGHVAEVERILDELRTPARGRLQRGGEKV